MAHLVPVEPGVTTHHSGAYYHNVNDNHYGFGSSLRHSARQKIHQNHLTGVFNSTPQLLYRYVRGLEPDGVSHTTANFVK